MIRTNCVQQKKLHVGVAERWMFILILLATLLRLFLIYSNWPTTISDESVIGLMALHINTRGEFPLFFYGQYYMGALEAYLGALAIHLFGPTIFSVRLGLLLLFAPYLICMYHLTRLLYSEKFALVSVAFLGFGSSIMMAQQLRAIGGYPEIILSGALIYLITVWLLLTSYPSQRIYSLEQQRRRMLRYSLLGLVMCFALYSDQLILPCIAMSGVLLLLFCWRDFIHWAGVCFLVGLLIGMLPLIIYYTRHISAFLEKRLLIGMLPLIIYNVHAAPGKDSLHVLLRLQQGGLATHGQTIFRLFSKPSEHL